MAMTMEWIRHALRDHPELALFLAMAAGYFLGRLRIGTFKLGPVVGCLLAGVAVGQLGIVVPSVLGRTFFLFFLFSVGYKTGPQFFKVVFRRSAAGCNIMPNATLSLVATSLQHGKTRVGGTLIGCRRTEVGTGPDARRVGTGRSCRGDGGECHGDGLGVVTAAPSKARQPQIHGGEILAGTEWGEDRQGGLVLGFLLDIATLVVKAPAEQVSTSGNQGYVIAPGKGGDCLAEATFSGRRLTAAPQQLAESAQHLRAECPIKDVREHAGCTPRQR